MRTLWPAGAQRIAIEEARAIQELGNDVQLLFLRRSSDYQGQYDELMADLNWHVIDNGVDRSVLGRISYIITSILNPISSFDSRVDISSLIKGVRFLKERNFDMVLYHDQYAAIIGFFLDLFHSRLFNVYVHDVGGFGQFTKSWQNVVHKLLNRAILIRSHAIFTNTRGTMSDLISLLGKQSNLHVLYPAVRANAEIESKGADPKEGIVLTVSTWEAGRVPEWYINVASHLCQGRIVMCGYWKDHSYYRSMLSKCKLEVPTGKIEITGPVSEQELEKLYSRTSLFLRYGNNEKGIGMGPLEAMAHGVPVVINKELGFTEILKDNSCGVILENTNPAFVASVLDDILSDGGRMNKMKQGSAKIVSELTWKKHVELLLSKAL